MVSPVQSPAGRHAVWLMPASLLVMLAVSVVGQGLAVPLAVTLVVQGLVGIGAVGWLGAQWLGVGLRLERPSPAELGLAVLAGVGVGAVGSGVLALAWTWSPAVREALAMREALQSQIALAPGVGGAVVAGVTLCLVPGVCEELLYRGTLRGAFAGVSPRRRAWWVAGLFAAAHVDWVLFAPLFLVGLVLDRVAAARGWGLAALSHVSLNGFGVFAWARLYAGEGPSVPGALGWIALGSAVCGVAVLALERRTRARASAVR